MNNSMKNYNKAVEKFQVGNIEKALEYCEEAVALDINNKAALNLKGMILYLKGNLHAAQASWKVNVNINNDGIAKSYLDNIKDDLLREKLYTKALKKIKDFNLDEAVVLLESAKESDFNAINVYNALTYCYIKLGDKEKAKECIEKVISVERNNKVANDYINELGLKGRGFSNIINKKVALAGSIAIGLVVIGGALMLSNSANFKKNTESKKPQSVISQNDERNKNDNKNNEETNSKDSEEKKKYNLKELIEKENYDELIVAMEKNRESITEENQKEFELAKELLETKGVKYFYDEGLNEFKNGEFGKANKEFQKGFKYAKGSYLENHLNYMIAVSFEKLDDKDNAIKYYSDYEKNFKESEYLEEVLYKLAILNKDRNISESKKYAEKLQYKFNDSIYNNNNIKSILESE
ncbi:tetratricopeptide repeat protein [Clostridium massiliamazoniense]|uniref:tetratricopeptide repeat protein n=1 Tax=Clostridium massiliamazoniense TaxID=1347366 RepID=UPI0006D825F3|nr:tetratricopeptide repeat protein [Clostridium massiliamazoniense]